MRDIRSITDAIQREGAHWRAGHTSLSSLPDSQLRLKLGCIPGPGEPSLQEAEQQGKARYAAYRASLPEHTGAARALEGRDWRSWHGENYTSPVKDQSFCGSCVAFGTAAALEGTLRIQRGDAYLPILCSEAHLFYVYAQQEGFGCNTGWYVSSAAAHMRDGITDASLYPYTPGDQPSRLPENWKQGYTLADSQATSDLEQMKTWLANDGMLITRFNVYDDFFSYVSGVYTPTSGAQFAGGHCVCVVGFSDTGRCWICKNSWGTAWGDQGFFKIAYGVCGIDFMMWLPTNVTRPSEQAATLGSRGKLASARHEDGRVRLWAVNNRYTWGCAKSTPASDSAWTEWTPYWSLSASTLPGIHAAQVTAAKGPDGRVRLFTLAADGALWSLEEGTAGGDPPQWNAWQPPFTTPEGVKAVEVAVGRIAGGRLQIWCVGSNGTLHSRFQRDDAGFPWSGWNAFQRVPDARVAHLACVSMANGAPRLFAIDTEGKVHTCRKQSPEPGSRWTAWTRFSRVKDRQLEQLAGACLPDGRPQLFGVTTHGELYTCQQKGMSPGSDWSGWRAFPQPAAKPVEGVAVAELPDKRLQLWATNDTGGGIYDFWTCWKTGREPDAPWTQWTKMPFPLRYRAAREQPAVAGVASMDMQERLEAPDDGRVPEPLAP